jgi:PKD repeat protein
MSFLRPRKILTGVILFSLTLSALAQHTGGDGSGAVLAPLIQSSCSAISYPAIYAGGDEDGYTLSGITQSSCSSVIMPNIFYGGQDGGYSISGVTQSSCSPIVLPAIFAGGQDDGYTLTGITQSSCSSPVLPGIYAGGQGNIDGVTQLNAGCAPVANFVASPLSVCAGDTVHFTDLSSGSPLTWSWTFTGGTPSSSTLQNPKVVYNTAGVYSVTLSITSLLGNSSITRTNYITVHALPTVTISGISPMCENATAITLTQGSPSGGTYSGPGITAGVFHPDIAGDGIHTINYVYTDGFGCHNSATTNITVNPVYSFNENHTICNGASYNWHGTNYTTAGIYTKNYTTIKGCDSIYTLSLAVSPVYAFSENHAICAGDTYNWHGTNYSTTGIFTANYTSINGCDSNYTLHLTVNPVYAFTENHSICNGANYNWHGTNYSTAGTYTADYNTINGCDSIYTLHLTVDPIYAFSENYSICNGDTYNWHGTNYTTAGTYNANYTSIHGCDSNYTLHLTVNPVYAFTENHVICSGDTYNWHGTAYTTPGTFTANYISKFGCDSIYTLNLSLRPVYSYSENHSICNGDSYNWQGTAYTSAGTYNINYTTNNGCDSTYTLNLSVYPTYFISSSASICDGDSYHWQGLDYTVGGTYTADYLSIHGCDSIYELVLTVNTVDVSLTITDPTITANATADAYQWLDCDNSYAPIGGATLQSYTATSNGNYAVIVTQGSCSDTSACVQIVAVGIATENLSGIALYPNPSDGRFTLVLDANANIEIFNAIGDLIYNAAFEKGKHSISLNIADGVYLLKATNDKASRSLKLLINK